MIAVRVVPKQNLRIGKLEPELFDRLLNRRHIPLVRAVDENVSLWCHDEEGAQRLRSDIVDVADNLVGWELRRLVLGSSHIARQYRLRGIGASMNSDGRVISRLALSQPDCQTEYQHRNRQWQGRPPLLC